MSEQTHFRPLACLYSSLYAHFGQGAEIYVAVQTPLHYDEQRPTLAKRPDLMVVPGVKDRQRTVFHLWEEQKVPSVIFEITSDATWLEDLVNKSALYMKLGVKEYFIFDPDGEFLKEYVQGLRLVEQQGHQEYMPIPLGKDGTLYSEVLGTNLIAQNHLLRLLDAAREEVIPWAAELKGYAVATSSDGESAVHSDEAMQLANERLQQTEARAQQAEERLRQLEEHAKRNGQETQRLKTLEAENAHLRVLLGQMQGTKVLR